MELVHHHPLRDVDDAPTSAFLQPRLTLIRDINMWRDSHCNINVYRSLSIWSDESKTMELFGPFILDIDNENNDLEDALQITRQAIHVVCSHNGNDGDIRVFFTGHKGFNIEILPSAIGITGTIRQQKTLRELKRRDIIQKLRQGKNLGSSSKDCSIPLGSNSVTANGTSIDQNQDYTRLHNSINKWIQDGTAKAREKTEFTIAELYNLSLEQIIAKSIT